MVNNLFGSARFKKSVAIVAALGVAQVSLISFADAPAPWVQKAEQKKKKKKAVRRAHRRAVQQTQTVQAAPEPAPQLVEAPVEPAPVPVAEAAPAPAPAAPAPAAAEVLSPVPQAAASGGGTGWLLPVIGALGLGGILLAATGGSDSN